MTAARLLMAAGAAALLGVAVVHVDGVLGERRARSELALVSPAPDTREWSKTRRAEWEASRSAPAGTPLGLLSIPSLGLSVVVFEGTDAISLNRGVGRIQGTRIQSNLGIAGHRDGFFRSLRNATKGDRITLETQGSTYAYEIRSLSIVSPEDVQVLDPTPGPTLTLVTCHPFFVLGHAPQRFIVHAVLVGESDSALSLSRAGMLL
jgi:sortase A